MECNQFNLNLEKAPEFLPKSLILLVGHTELENEATQFNVYLVHRPSLAIDSVL